jgi:hypothetical protein
MTWSSLHRNGMTAPGLILNLWPTILMRNHWPSRGRRKTVEQFTVREGFWMLGIVGVILMGLMLLALFGYLNFDMD